MLACHIPNEGYRSCESFTDRHSFRRSSGSVFHWPDSSIRGQGVDGFGDQAIEPLIKRGIADRSISNVLRGQENTGTEDVRLEECEERPELVLDDKRVALASAGGHEADRLSDQRLIVDEIDKMLNRPVAGSG
jgi:hypothetical protein